MIDEITNVSTVAMAAPMVPKFTIKNQSNRILITIVMIPKYRFIVIFFIIVSIVDVVALKVAETKYPIHSILKFNTES